MTLRNNHLFVLLPVFHHDNVSEVQRLTCPSAPFCIKYCFYHHLDCKHINQECMYQTVILNSLGHYAGLQTRVYISGKFASCKQCC